LRGGEREEGCEEQGQAGRSVVEEASHGNKNLTIRGARTKVRRVEQRAGGGGPGERWR
jgi:hypothetical protein